MTVVPIRGTSALIQDILDTYQHLPTIASRFTACLIAYAPVCRTRTDLEDMFDNFDSYWHLKGVNMFDDFEEKSVIYKAVGATI